MKCIKYIGDDLVLGPFTALYKDKVYRLYYDWNGTDNINGYYIFHIYDDLPLKPEYYKEFEKVRGYELPIKDVISLRDSNLDLLL